MNGLWIHDAKTSRFSDYAPSLLPEWDKLWWILGGRAGEIDGNWWNDDENEAFLNNALVFSANHCAPFNKLWRPGSMERMAPHLLVDEWSYFCGIDVPDIEGAERRSRHLMENGTLMNFLDVAEGRAEIVIFDADDCLLFVFSTRQDWLDILSAQSENAEKITALDWKNWLRPFF